MFKRLLIPLDGSRLAETAIPAAIFVAQKAGSSMVLLHIIEKDAPKSVHGERHLTSTEEAKAYLAEIAKRWIPESIKTDLHVHDLATENVARGIADHLLELHQDTVVMNAHGHGGLRDILFGNIAQQVVARCLFFSFVRVTAASVVTKFCCRTMGFRNTNRLCNTEWNWQD